MKRIPAIDTLRGLVMIIMALDHVRDFMHVQSIQQSPTDLNTTTAALFFTRWITHFCAPIFVFLAGSSAYFMVKNSGDFKRAQTHLWKRGFCLLLFEFSLVNFALYFDIGFHMLLFEVIASTGLGFIFLSGMLKLPSPYVGATGLAIICFHSLFQYIPFEETSIWKAILTPFFNPTAIPLLPEKIFVMAYPPIPWFGILLIGFSCARFFEFAPEKQRRLFGTLGLGCLLVFTIVRYINGYGDSMPWAGQKEGLFTFFSFINVTKYPPSFLFCLLTLGTMFLILAFIDRLGKGFQKIAKVYGRAPLFYFIVHFYFIHVLTLGMLWLQGYEWASLDFARGSFGRPIGVISGLSLWGIYGVWLFVVGALYRPCLWFSRYKSTHQHWWLRYI